MFSYYGRKSKVIKYYPNPKHHKIIEPFCGSAVYSLYAKNWENDVLLVDKFDVIINVWEWLKSSTKKDILGLPPIKQGDDIRTFGLSKSEMLFMGFWINRGTERPKYTVTPWVGQNPGYWERIKNTTAENLHKIKHWKFQCDDYCNIPNQTATWFIDPPYQTGGERYVHKDINFESLSKWCLSRKGQIIVCENQINTWLPFVPLKEIRGQKHRTTETIFHYQSKRKKKRKTLIKN